VVSGQFLFPGAGNIRILSPQRLIAVF